MPFNAALALFLWCWRWVSLLVRLIEFLGFRSHGQIANAGFSACSPYRRTGSMDVMMMQQQGVELRQLWHFKAGTLILLFSWRKFWIRRLIFLHVFAWMPETKIMSLPCERMDQFGVFLKKNGTRVFRNRIWIFWTKFSPLSRQFLFCHWKELVLASCMWTYGTGEAGDNETNKTQ